MNSSPDAGRRAFLKFGAFVLLCSLPWTAQAQTDADRDGDGLIEIDSLLMLHNMRHNLTGTSYKTSASSAGDDSGCPTNTGCIGYELTQDLDFDVNGDGSTWSGNAEDGFTLDSGDTEANYFPVADGGWEPIGNGANPFAAVFDGNTHTISNLAIRRDQTFVGLFGRTDLGAAIRNLGLVDNLADYTGSSNRDIFIGGLVGYQYLGSITASYATGDADGGDGHSDYVGGLVGRSLGSITASYATGDADGGDGDYDEVGGLVGFQVRGSITASYAAGDADGGDGDHDEVGGLVGYQNQGSITASYATGDADGGDGDHDEVGGLVGYQYQGSITASYATGDADGGDGDQDEVGGLVGYQYQGSITASYATGDADGGDGDQDKVGGLVSNLIGSITASYGFGGTIGGEAVGLDGSTKPQGVSTAAQLTEANAGSAWNSAVDNSLGAWDFGTDEQIPALNYADYDGPGTVFDCSQFPANACDPPTLLPSQADASASGPSVAGGGETVSLVASLLFGRAAIVSWSWRQLEGPEVTLSDADASETTFTAPTVSTSTLLVFEMTATDSEGRQYTERISLAVVDFDRDGDGLIEIDSLLMLHNMRHNLAGTSYKESADALGVAYGCPAAGCRGYELTRNLDFDVDGDGTWSRNNEGSYTLDVDDRNDDYFPVDGDGTGGWLPIGDGTSPFVAVFDGNGHKISNLAIRRDQTYVGLFGVTAGVIRNLGLVDNLADYTGSSDSDIFIGGLVGQQEGGSITASYATGDADGGDGNQDEVGGLVGYQYQGSITASYATGDADGGDGDQDEVGGLVGYQYQGSITASYATGDADGGDGNQDEVGGLVGYQYQGSITASYATGDADGGDGDQDEVGGLVGYQYQGSITASYATGDADGGSGAFDRVGGLVGRQGNGSSITASYGFGGTIGGEAVGSDGSTKPQGVSTATQLTADNAGATWNSAVDNSLGAWNFGTDVQIPALNYADYDGPGTVFDCSQFPANACDPPTLLPGHDETSASGPSAAEHGEIVNLAGSLLFGRVTIESWSWQQLEGPEVTLSDAAARETTFTASVMTREPLVFKLTATDSEGRQYTDRISVAIIIEADLNSNGLIEIYSLTDLHNMRHNLAGTSYKASAASGGDNTGCPATGCIGYELMRDLDFDVDGDGSTWSGNANLGYSLDSGDRHAGYFPVDGDDAGGWLPIGVETNSFVAVFDGNTHTISNLAIRRDQISIGLFGVTGSGAAIRNLGLVDNLADHTGSSGSHINIGGLVGWQGTGSSITASYATGDANGGVGDYDRVGGLVGQSQGSITASYATGDADGGDGDLDRVGGLVGRQGNGSSITASYATGDADGGDGNNNRVGGLVGLQLAAGSITASYATGDADGGDDNYDRVGGLVGLSQGSITASYATGDADGGDGDSDQVGGLVGLSQGSITASYATGDADGGDGDSDQVGGLVGLSQSSITASYATGDADGGDGDSDQVGGLVGRSLGSITASYGFGGTIGGEAVGSDGSTKPQGVSTAAQLTAANAVPSWNRARKNTLGAWDFGTDEQIPALNYADYDGPGTVFDCSQFPANACGTGTPTLLPGQADAAVSASGPSATGRGETVSLVASLLFGRVTIESWSWRQLEGPEVTLSDADARETTFTVPTASTSTRLVFELTATDSEGRQYTERISLAVVVDRDGDGLIEIDSLLMLHNMRHNLAGTSYKASSASVGDSSGCPAMGCIGYELTRNLDFDGDSDGSTWSGNAEDGFTLDLGDSEADYFPVDGDNAGGWSPIGDGTPFVAVFDGNGHTISNLAIRRDQSYVGLFGVIGNDGGLGAVIRNLGLVDNLADYTGSSDSDIYIGGLVGLQESGSITASYATGDADGGDGDQDEVGGLVGYQYQGSITASYATGDADGGDGDQDEVGGLVGYQYQGSITASYATGDADGGDGDSDQVGGLVGMSQGSITASYATGDADGGDGDRDYVGGLTGYQYQGLITGSYGFGGMIGGESVGSGGSTKPQGVSTAAQLTAANAVPSWNRARKNTLGAWDFGTDEQIPALNYADYDGPGTVFDCSQFPANACDPPTLLPSQADASASGPSVAEHGETVSLAGSILFGRVTIESWSWQQLEGPEVTLSDAAARETTFTALVMTRDPVVFKLTATDSEGRQYTDRISVAMMIEADLDSNGLIEIYSLTDLHNMRHNLAGTSYKASTASVGDASGCPAMGCIGYELMRDLDFDVDGDGSTWSGNANVGYSLDSGDRHAGYFPGDGDDAGGWLPIGDGINPFVAVFDGNTHTISNLAIRRDQAYVGLFGAIGIDGESSAAIRNLGLVDNLADYTGSSDSDIGGLVGHQNGGLITASYATGDADGGDGNGDRVGGLVGRQDSLSSITASYATGDADGGDGDYDYVGGLVGLSHGPITASYATGDADGGDGDYDYVGGLVGLSHGPITASYATGDADGGDGDQDRVGGLVGQQDSLSSITASYATGDADGGDGNGDRVGGLVGQQDSLSSITASYATGDADGGDGDYDYVGGLVGLSHALITASYATGDADGGDGDLDRVGGLVGQQNGGSITASYATGDADGGDGNGDRVGGLVGRQDSLSSITASYATGDADGGDGDQDRAGGLVGYQLQSSITASYATGDADGGDGDQDRVGGLVGQQDSLSSITASYATGDADGGDGDQDRVGGLVGQSHGSISASYGFGGTIGGESVGSDGSTKPQGVSTEAQLTAANTGSAWNDADTNTLGAWNFGTNNQVPVLNYADYDGTGTVFDCSQFPTGVCGTLLPGRLSVSLTLEGAVTTVAEGARVTLSAELSSAVANETVVRLVVVAGGQNHADDADIVIKGDEFSVTIAAGAASGTTAFTVLDDDIDEGAETLVIGIAEGDLIADQIIEVTILDDDTRGVEISATSLNLTEGERGSYTVVLTSQPNTGSVTVIAASSDPDRVRIGDITAGSMPSDLVFSAESWHIPRIVQITTSPDPDGTDTDVAITHQVMADVGGDYTGETAADVVVTVGQRQLSVSLTLEGTVTTVAEGARVTLSAELSSAVANETVVRLVVVAGGQNHADDADIVIKGDEFSVTIAAGAASGTTAFTVLDDDIDEGAETLVIAIAEGDLIADQIIEVTILDDDTRGVEISATSLNLTEGERGSYTVVLTSQPNTGSVTVIAASSDPDRVRIGAITAGSMPSDLVFSAESWHIPRIVQITTSPDSRRNGYRCCDHSSGDG